MSMQRVLWVTFAASLVAAPRLASASISVYIAEPTAGAVAGDTLSVTAQVVSTNQLQQVHAQVQSFGADLSSSMTQTWVGTFDLSTLPKGSYSLTVTATDIFG